MRHESDCYRPIESLELEMKDRLAAKDTEINYLRATINAFIKADTARADKCIINTVTMVRHLSAQQAAALDDQWLRCVQALYATTKQVTVAQEPTVITADVDVISEDFAVTMKTIATVYEERDRVMAVVREFLKAYAEKDSVERHETLIRTTAALRSLVAAAPKAEAMPDKRDSVNEGEYQAHVAETKELDKEDS